MGHVLHGAVRLQIHDPYSYINTELQISINQFNKMFQLCDFGLGRVFAVFAADTKDGLQCASAGARLGIQSTVQLKEVIGNAIGDRRRCF